MLHVALLVAALSTANPPSTAAQSPIQRCLATMDGAVYHGDPSDRTLMKADVDTCVRGRIAAMRIRVLPKEGPAKLFIMARLLDRAATLSYMGLDDAGTALHEVQTANVYFRIAAGLSRQSDDFHTAALANVELTSLQLRTLRTDIAAAKTPHPTAVALRSKN